MAKHLFEQRKPQSKHAAIMLLMGGASLIIKCAGSLSWRVKTHNFLSTTMHKQKLEIC